MLWQFDSIFWKPFLDGEFLWQCSYGNSLRQLYGNLVNPCKNLDERDVQKNRVYNMEENIDEKSLLFTHGVEEQCLGPLWISMDSCQRSQRLRSSATMCSHVCSQEARNSAALHSHGFECMLHSSE